MQGAMFTSPNNTPTNAGSISDQNQQHPYQCRLLSQFIPTTPLPMQAGKPVFTNNTPTNAGTTPGRANNTPTNAGYGYRGFMGKQRDMANNTPTNAGRFPPVSNNTPTNAG
jgi:hypothetical protein